jgi:hypothetical protein
VLVGGSVQLLLDNAGAINPEPALFKEWVTRSEEDIPVG